MWEASQRGLGFCTKAHRSWGQTRQVPRGRTGRSPYNEEELRCPRDRRSQSCPTPASVRANIEKRLIFPEFFSLHREVLPHWTRNAVHLCSEGMKNIFPNQNPLLSHFLGFRWGDEEGVTRNWTISLRTLASHILNTWGTKFPRNATLLLDQKNVDYSHFMITIPVP